MPAKKINSLTFSSLNRRQPLKMELKRSLKYALVEKLQFIAFDASIK